MADRIIKSTRDYSLFGRNKENRSLKVEKHKRLAASMGKYGFLPCFPIVVGPPNKHGKMLLKEGQHRLAIAEVLGAEVWYVIEPVDFDVAIINCTSKNWQTLDYAEKYHKNGIEDYGECIDFARAHALSIGISAAMLAGYTAWKHVAEDFVSGDFRIKARDWADKVVGIYDPLVLMSSALKGDRFLQACMALCRLEGFSARRLLMGAEKRRHKLKSLTARDAYLDLMEECYNYGQQTKVPLKVPAMEAMRKRPGKNSEEDEEAA